MKFVDNYRSNQEGPYMTTAINTSDIKYVAALDSVRQSYARLADTWDNRVRSADKAVTDKIHVRRFNSEMLLNNHVGHRNPEKGTHLVYGDWNPLGNIEGSLYFLRGFDNEQCTFTHTLRVRWGRTISYGRTELSFSRGLYITSLGGRRIRTHIDGGLYFAHYDGDEPAHIPILDLDLILEAVEMVRESLDAANAELVEFVASAEPVKQ